MINIVRTDSDNEDFRSLVRLLDADLALRDGEDHAFYAQFNKIDKIKQAVVAYLDGEPAGTGALREYEPGCAEVKRMYVKPELRRRGVAKAVLAELEDWARELNFDTCILETGKKQPEAIALYLGCHYTITPNYGQYADVDDSVCMAKNMKQPA